jgi:hypothetical protein
MPAAPLARFGPRSDHARFFGDGIKLMLKELELGLERRDFPGEVVVLDDELLEEGDDGLVGMIGFHVRNEWCVRQNLATAARLRRRARMIPGRGKERPGGLLFKREYSLGLSGRWGTSVGVFVVLKTCTHSARPRAGVKVRRCPSPMETGNRDECCGHLSPANHPVSGAALVCPG